MRRFILTRIGLGLAQCAVVLVVAFALTALLPGDTAAVLAGEQATPDQLAAIRQRLGLDEPLATRFLGWVGGVSHGDLGRSLVTGTPVAEEISRRLATTAVLAGITALLLVPLALLLGVFSGLREGSMVDRAVNGLAILLHAVPEFVLGLLLLAAFAVYSGLLPATAAGLTGSALLAEPLVLLLPVTVLLARQLCDLARQVRIGVAEQNNTELAGHLRLLGLPERTVLLRHVLPNALAPAVQQLARCVDGLLGGAVVVESLFAIAGLGTGFVEAVQNRDLPLVQGYVLIFAGVTIVVNLLADLLAYRLVPRREVLV